MIGAPERSEGEFQPLPNTENVVIAANSILARYNGDLRGAIIDALISEALTRNQFSPIETCLFWKQVVEELQARQ